MNRCELSEAWGTSVYSQAIADFRGTERAALRRPNEPPASEQRPHPNRYGMINRNTATPDVARAITRMIWETDVRAVLPSVRTPCALVTGTQDRVDEARYIASLMPNATVHVVEGKSGVALEPILDILRNLAGVAPSPPELETVLSTVLFTDIVDATARQATLGDHAWRELISSHHSLVREALHRWRGVENDTAGDGFYATFDGPARAIRCALQVRARVRDLGIEIRAGVHTGECEVFDGKCTGLAVSIGARVAARAGPSQVLVTQTVKDLVAGSGFTFADAGEHELKGVPGAWRLHAAS